MVSTGSFGTFVIIYFTFITVFVFVFWSLFVFVYWIISRKRNRNLFVGSVCVICPSCGFKTVLAKVISSTRVDEVISDFGVTGEGATIMCLCGSKIKTGKDIKIILGD